MSEKLTVMEVFERTADKHSDKPALKYKQGERWRVITWGEYRDQVRKAAKGLIKIGLEPKKSVSLIGFNCPQWVIGDLAAIYAGGCPAGIYTTNSPEQCQYVAAHSEAQVAIVENRVQLEKFKAVREQLPELKAIVMMHGDDSDDDVYSWQEFLRLGEEVSDEELQKRIDGQQTDDVCTYIYTSGTTGDPKAVMISHDNITWTASSALNTLGYAPGDVVLSYLPLSHIAEQVMTIHGPMVTEAVTVFAESIDKLADNLKEVRPTMFLGVPRVWEKIQAKMMSSLAEATGFKKRLGGWARSVGLSGGYADQSGDSRPLLYGVADRLVFNKVRIALGLDRSRIQVTSAAPISKSTLEFFLGFGIPIMEIYGMSECTGPATMSLPHKYKTGTVGTKLGDSELKIAEDGEICMRGRHVFKGYFKNKEATDEAIDSDGWLHSGDIGEIDSEGFLRITDRKKDLLITAGGENIAPQLIEGHLKSIPAVAQAVVVGDRQKHLSALLTLDEMSLEETLRAAGASATDMAAAAEDPKVHQWLLAQVQEVNQQLARVQTIKKIKILPADLSIEGGELTPTMKVKRKVINKKYGHLIDAFYA